VGALGIAVAAQAGRRGDDARGYSVCVLTALLVSPVSWSHHWALAVPALLLLACGAWRARSRPAMLGCAALAAIALSRVIWWVPVNHPEHSELHLGATQLLYADAYVLVAIVLLALAVGSGARDRRARAGPAT
jgi:alpha-1,2-mannosyltransferase